MVIQLAAITIATIREHQQWATRPLEIVMPHLTRYAVGLCAAGYGALQILGRQAGSTRQERRQTLPGDGAVRHPHAVTDHAITIGTLPEQVWPWLAQMGWHLGGYYTPRWVDRLLFPANAPSLDVLDPDLLRDLAVGDTIPDGPPGTAWYVVEEAARRARSSCTPPRTSRRPGGTNSALPSTGRGAFT